MHLCGCHFVAFLTAGTQWFTHSQFDSVWSAFAATVEKVTGIFLHLKVPRSPMVEHKLACFNNSKISLAIIKFPLPRNYPKGELKTATSDSKKQTDHFGLRCFKVFLSFFFWNNAEGISMCSVVMRRIHYSAFKKSKAAQWPSPDDILDFAFSYLGLIFYSL